MRAVGVIAIASIASFFVACSNGAPSTIVLNEDPGIPSCDGSQSPGEVCSDLHDGEEVNGQIAARTSDAPLNTILVHGRLGNEARAHLSVTSFRDDPTADERVLVLREEARVRSALEPSNVAIGTCGARTTTPTIEAPSLRVNRGFLRLIAGRSDVVDSSDARGISPGSTRSYEAGYDYAKFAGEPRWGLTFDGCEPTRAFSVNDVTSPIPTLLVTAPSVAGDGLTVSSGPLTIEWAATNARRIVISVGDTVCAVDPLARSFTIPREAIGGPGENVVRIEAGDIRRLGIPSLGRAILTMQLHTQTFALHVR